MKTLKYTLPYLLVLVFSISAIYFGIKHMHSTGIHQEVKFDSFFIDRVINEDLHIAVPELKEANVLITTAYMEGEIIYTNSIVYDTVDCNKVKSEKDKAQEFLNNYLAEQEHLQDLKNSVNNCKD